MYKINLHSHILSIVLLFVTHEIVNAQTIAKDTYKEKTLACIVGQMAGISTGYEFEKKSDGTPRICHPDNWFDWCRGTLGGSSYDQYNYSTRNPSNGIVLSDDDIHIDLFNQYIINRYGINVSEQDFREAWLFHDVKDWGSGGVAMSIMKNSNYIPPYTGQRLTGNYLGEILTEGWIEQETMGCLFPGLPNSSVWYARMAASLSSDGEALEWGQWWAAVYSIAYFESDARIVLEKSIEILHPNSWGREVYKKAKFIFTNYPNDWRTGMNQMFNWNNCGGHLYFLSDISWQEKLDRNMGFAMLSILYGANDYTQTVKIASLAGLDGDCTAASVAGLMGIIKGMEGTPKIVKDRIYANNTGYYQNDFTNGASIGKDYPSTEKIDDIIALYVENTEIMISSLGGSINEDSYYIPLQKASNNGLALLNSGFEEGNLDNWIVEKENPNIAIFAEEQYDNHGFSLSHTGKWKATIVTTNSTDSASIYQTISGLIPGRTYKVSGSFYTAANRQVRLFAKDFDSSGIKIYSSKMENVTDGWNTLTLYVKMGQQNTSMKIGMEAPATENTQKWCCADDFRFELCDELPKFKYQAEDAIINNARKEKNYVGGIDHPDSFLEWSVDGKSDGRSSLFINYANGSGLGGFATLKLWINDTFICDIPMPRTGEWGVFSQNIIEVPVKPMLGKNIIKLAKGSNFVEIDYVEIAERKVRTGIEVVTSSKGIIKDQKSELKLYPNPVNNWLNIEYGDKYDIISLPVQIEIFDINGETVINHIGYSVSQLDVSKLKSGIYILKSVSGSDCQYKKFLKN